MSFDVSTNAPQPGTVIVRFTGQFDFSHVATARTAINQRIEQGAKLIIVNLDGLEYIDSAGLGMVATCAGIMFKAAGKLVVVSPGGRITQMFEITRLNRVIDLYPDFNAACAALTPASTASSGA